MYKKSFTFSKRLGYSFPLQRLDLNIEKENDIVRCMRHAVRIRVYV